MRYGVPVHMLRSSPHLISRIENLAVDKQVQIFEKSSFENEIGAAITITSNGMRILDRWNFDAAGARGAVTKQLRMVDHQSLQNVVVESFRDVAKDYGAPIMSFHRVDLHHALRAMAESKDSQPGIPAVIHKGKSVVAVDCDSGTITLEDGTNVEKDLLVIADGIKVSLEGRDFCKLKLNH